MKQKRFLVLPVIALLVVALTAGTALADSPWKDKEVKGKGKQVQIKVEKEQEKGKELGKQLQDKKQDKERSQDWECDFSDVSPNHWACKRIKAMAKRGIVKGYGNGKFQPNAAVSKIEALTMIVRASEGVDRDDLKDALKDADTYKRIPAWAKGYVAIALDEGILEKDDLDNFRPNAAAKRKEVVILLGRALDIDTDDDYEDLNFSDLKQIPKEALEYLPFLVDEGYITGYHNGKFMPNKPITRAELVNIIAKVVEDEDDENDDDKDRETITGIFRSYDDDDATITLRVKGKNKTYDLDKDVEVEIDGDEADLDDLVPGMDIELEIDDDKVVEISAEELDKIEGEFVSYDIDNEEITIKIDGVEFTFELDKDVEVEIEIDGDDIDLEDLDEEIDLELKFDNGKVIKVEGED